MKVAAHYAFFGKSDLRPYYGLELDSQGTIVSTFNFDRHKESAGTAFYAGLLCPYLLDPIHDSGNSLLKLLENDAFELKNIDQIGHEFSDELSSVPVGIIFDRLLSLQNKYTFLVLLELFTRTAAQVLTNHNLKGNLEKGNRPGLTYIEGINWKDFSATSRCKLNIIFEA